MRSTLEYLSELSFAWLDAKEAVEAAELNLKIAKERLRLLSEESIPGVMQELQLSSITLDNGKKLNVKQDVYAQMTNDMKPKAYKWLADNNCDGIIKVNVIGEFGRGKREDAISWYQQFMDNGIEASMSESIHAQTLAAFLREQLRKGSDIPLELFGARPVWVAKIK